MSKKIKGNQQPLWRLGLVFVLSIAMLIVIGWKTAKLQVLDNEVPQKEGDARSLRDQDIIATRGNILDRNGEPLALSTPVTTLTINPREFFAGLKTNPEQANKLNEAFKKLKLNTGDWQKRMKENANKQYLLLARRLPPAQAEEIVALKIKGLRTEEEYKRYYPMGEAGVHLIGLANINDEEGQEVGVEGLEKAYEISLKGTSGSRRVEIDGKGGLVHDLGVTKSAEPGNDLQLSIDSRLQYHAYKVLKEVVTQRGAEAGTAIVLDARSGEVLAMVNQPSWNPNNRTGNAKVLRNSAIVDSLEPGSTIKTFTVTAALESGKFDLNSVLETNPVIIDRRRLKDVGNFGPSKLERIVAKSSNVGAAKIGLEIGHEAMLSVFKRVGFGEDIGIGFPGEASGALPARERWSRGETAALAYGYGLKVTPLQLAQAYLVYANRGLRKPISLLKVNGPVQGAQVIDERIASDVVDMLRQVVSKEAGGTGVRANIPSYSVAGKSGTSWLYIPGKGYDTKNTIAHFAGFVPADDPRVIIVVSITKPQGVEVNGGVVAAPVFSQIAAGAMRILDVPPESPKLSATLPNSNAPVEVSPQSESLPFEELGPIDAGSGGGEQ